MPLEQSLETTGFNPGNYIFVNFSVCKFWKLGMAILVSHRMVLSEPKTEVLSENYEGSNRLILLNR
jgi:hypothetical protein